MGELDIDYRIALQSMASWDGVITEKGGPLHTHPARSLNCFRVHALFFRPVVSTILTAVGPWWDLPVNKALEVSKNAQKTVSSTGDR